MNADKVAMKESGCPGVQVLEKTGARKGAQRPPRGETTPPYKVRRTLRVRVSPRKVQTGPRGEGGAGTTLPFPVGFGHCRGSCPGPCPSAVRTTGLKSGRPWCTGPLPFTSLDKTLQSCFLLK